MKRFIPRMILVVLALVLLVPASAGAKVREGQRCHPLVAQLISSDSKANAASGVVVIKKVQRPKGYRCIAGRWRAKHPSYYQLVQRHLPEWMQQKFKRIARCESTNRPWLSTGNGFYGWIQFTLASWRSVGMKGYPHKASKWQQMWAGYKLMLRQGWNAWPVCSHT
jgi:hypothetical protein